MTALMIRRVFWILTACTVPLLSGCQEKPSAPNSNSKSNSMSEPNNNSQAIQKTVVQSSSSKKFSIFNWLPKFNKDESKQQAENTNPAQKQEEKAPKNEAISGAYNSPPIPVSQTAADKKRVNDSLALARDVFSHPPLSNAESPELQDLIRGTKTYHADLKRLQQLQQKPDPQALDFLLSVAKNELNPLAPTAVYQLRYYPGSDTEDFLQKRLESTNEKIRVMALSSFACLNERQALKEAQNALEDRDAGVRTAAILFLGLAKDKSATRKLYQMLPKSQPGMGLYIAWALLQTTKQNSIERDHALQYMKKLARSDSTQFAVQAITFLRTETSPEILCLLYDCLYSRWESVRRAAGDSLNTIDPDYRDQALKGYAPDRQVAITSRLALLNHQYHAMAAPEDLSGSLNSNDMQDRLLALESMKNRERVADIPELIRLLDDGAKPVREKALLVLNTIINAKHMSRGPDDSGDQMAWCRWWLRHYRVLAATDCRALIQSPLGETCELTPGVWLDFRAQVKAIRAGSMPEGREGARVELELSGQPIILVP